MSTDIKHTQLTRVGYTYQDYICIKLLIEWFHDPHRYQWVTIEGARTEEGSLKSIDDIVAVDKDGKYTILQVKFTIDSSRKDLKLDFDWLIEKKKKGTSLIQKWVKDVKLYSERGSLGYAALKTNRKPDDELFRCLENNKINICNVPENRLNQIIEQLGSYEEAANFFSVFVFDHSQAEIEDLHGQLFNRVVPNHATPEGWYRFLEAVQHWATHKNSPSPDGKISLNHLYEIFDSGIGRSLPQFFEVPEGYAPPSGQFHAEMLRKTMATGGWVVSGLPGMGKSTYLSYLTAQLVATEIPVIRHHYSLSTQTIVDRTTYPNVARSLQHQIQTIYPDPFAGREVDPDQLDVWLEIASEHAKAENKKLVVIVDGLDHVSREQKEISQLEHLVNRLLPFKDKLCLIFGTQPVRDSYLPVRLIAEISKLDRWINLPSMDLHSIMCWVNSLSENGEVDLAIYEGNKSEVLIEVAEALLKSSGGYPLHIFYSLEHLTVLRKTVNSYEIEKLPACPDGDIRLYYAALWASLPETSREVLLLIACVDFPWPNRNSIGFCFGQSLDFADAFSKIQHLIQKRRSGIFPFHSSIIIFLRERKEFEDSSQALLVKVRDWLDRDAPSYWRWGWQWIIDAQFGDPEALINGITRDWLLTSLCNGYPPQHVEHIISTAEKFALEYGMYPELVNLRLLKIRLINGPEFQIQDYPQFMKCSISWSDNKYGLYWAADNLRMLNEREISIVGILFKGVDDKVGEECFKEIMRRIDFYAKVGGESEANKINALVDSAIDVLSYADNPRPQEIMGFMDRIVDKRSYYIKLFDRLFEAGNAYIILSIPHSSLPVEVLDIFWNYFVLACGDQQVSILDRSERKLAVASPLGAISLILNGQSLDVELISSPEVDYDADSINVEIFYDTFFGSLALQLQKEHELTAPSIGGVRDVRSFITTALHIVRYVAFFIAHTINSGVRVDAFAIHEIFLRSGLARTRGHDYKLTGAEFTLEHAITKISCHIHLLLGPGRINPITTLSMDALSHNPWWYAQGWLKSAASTIPGMIPDDYADRVIKTRIDELNKERSDTSILANGALELTSLAHALGRKEVGIECLSLTAKHILGYGWRKDTTFSELFDAIQYCSDYGVGDISNWLRRVAPFVKDVFEFSEREIRHIPGWYFELLSKYAPERLVDEFEYHIVNQDWVVVSEILSIFISVCDLSSLADYKLLRCISSHDCISALEKRAQTDDRFSQLLQDQRSLLGGTPPQPREKTSTFIEDKDIEIPLCKYPPDELDALYHELKYEKGLFSADGFIRSWVVHWLESGQGLELISAFEKFWDSHGEFPYLMRSAIGDIFRVSLQLMGKRAAYIWAVRDIRTNNHWGRWSGSHSEASLKKYATTYSSEWKQLLNDTTVGEGIRVRGNEWVVVPSCQLVSYLLAAGQLDLACKVTEVMLASLEAEIEHLPLSPLHWYQLATPRDLLSSKILLHCYKWPDRFIRRRTAMQIADLLIEDVNFRSLYLEYLADLKYEVEVSDFLSILTLLPLKIFEAEELVAAIKYPSELSSMILDKLGYGDTVSSRLEHFSDLGGHQFVTSNRFEKSKNGVAPVYYSPIGRLGLKLGYPLDKHLSAEWDLIADRKPFLFFNPHDFSSDHFFPHDEIGCSFSVQAEVVLTSAYARTISFAADKFGFPQDFVSYHLLKLLPFSDLLGRLLPTNKPNNWPYFEIIDDKSSLPSQEDLDRFLIDLASGEQVILSANGPVLRQISGVSCDLEIMMVFLGSNYDSDVKDLYNFLIGRDESLNLDAYKIADQIYPEDIGRFETDFLLRGLYRPQFTIGGTNTKVDVSVSSISYFAGETCNAAWKYWTDSWYPVWDRGLGPALGTYLETSNHILNVLKEYIPGSYCLLAKLTVVDKCGYSRERNQVELYGMVKI